jgi:hypothetical protein
MTRRPARTAILWQAGDWRIVRERQTRCAKMTTRLSLLGDRTGLAGGTA